MNERIHWYARRAPTPARPLRGAIEADAVVVGGGVAGLICARHLRAAGARVVLLERDFCGAGASGESSGFITPAAEIDLAALVGSKGPDEARRLWEFASSGVELLRSAIREHSLECDVLEQDCLYVAGRGLRAGAVREEHAARQELGYSGALFADNAVTCVLGTARYSAALRFGNTFSIDPYACCQGLRAVLEANGVTIHEASAATRVRADGVDTPNGSVRAEHVVVCTDRWTPELGALARAVYHVQTFLGMSEPLAADALRRVFPSGPVMTWDAALIYSHFRVAEGNRLLLGGGNLLHTYAGHPPRSLEPFAQHARAHFEATFPGVELRIESAWSGMLGVSKDLLPILGPDPQRPSICYVGAATGLPWAAALGRYAAERILRGRRDFDAAFSPTRKFLIGPKLQALLSTPATFALTHAVTRLR